MATAAAAIEAIAIGFTPLPFVIDPLDSLRPGGPLARGDGNVWLHPASAPGGPPATPEAGRLHWPQVDFAAAGPNRLPLGTPAWDWAYGDLDAGFGRAALVLGGTFDGHDCPPDLHPLTKASVEALAGQGLLAVAKDTFPRNGQTFSFAASFAEAEVDLATGAYRILDFFAAADAGMVVHPRASGGQRAPALWKPMPVQGMA